MEDFLNLLNRQKSSKTDIVVNLLNIVGIGIVIIEVTGHRIVFANEKFLDLCGYGLEEIVGKECNSLLCPAQKGFCPITDLGQDVDNSERILITADRVSLPIIKTVIPFMVEGKEYLLESVVDNSGQFAARNEILKTNADLQTEVDKRKKAQDQLNHLAYHDFLTGLPNRLLFIERLDRKLTLLGRARKEEQDKIFAVMMLDLDEFKVLNDTMGHALGDEMLAGVAVRLQEALSESDILARSGGDEFIILLNNVTSIREIIQVADRIIDGFSMPFNVYGQDIFITGSLGVAVYPTDGTDYVTIVQNADIAMYRAKEMGRNQWTFCTAEMKDTVNEYMYLSNDLYQALAQDEFVLHYQPMIDSVTGKVACMEALIRWQHPTRGMISPLKFINIAERTGLIHKLGEWVIVTALKQNKKWQDDGLPCIPISVNLSVMQFNVPGFVNDVARLIRYSGLESKYLELEITENIAMRDLAAIIKKLHKLKDLGVSISIDDFGTGYSSLQYLKQIPADKLKIAMPFVRGIELSAQDRVIVKTILIMAENLGLSVVAEGVETKEQFEFLRENNCKEIQGYFFSRPLPPEEMEEYLRRDMSKR